MKTIHIKRSTYEAMEQIAADHGKPMIRNPDYDAGLPLIGIEVDKQVYTIMQGIDSDPDVALRQVIAYGYRKH